MFKCDRSTVFRQTLLDASIKNPLGFRERDLIPLFDKYQRNRQIAIDVLSFLTYVLKLPTLPFLRHWRHSNFALLNRKDKWFRTLSRSNNNTPKQTNQIQ
ncbi:hypothetical protein IQ255_29000 [Pleurocapsales cyanobacterium LEGE 10410]|nr:hypothetical protein [Pleurocapsales cyanobacterium LEGE 10410]